MKEITNPHLSPSRAVVLARERAKRRQGCMWAGLLSTENHIARSAEVVSKAEGKTARAALVRPGRAPRWSKNPRTYVRSWDLGGLPVTMLRCNVVAKVKAVAKRRMDGGEESDSGIVPTMKPANKTWAATRRSWWREGLGATGDAKERSCSEHRVGKPLDWVRCWTGTERHCSPARGDVNTGARSRMR